jgi:hypothetical protein
MADQMTVVFVERTGHVLGGITGVAPAGDKPTPAEVAGAAMPVRFENTLMAATSLTSLTIPTSQLRVEILGFDPRVFENPRVTRVTYATPPDKDPFLAFVSAANGQVVTPLGADTFQVTTTLGTAPTSDTDFWVLFQGPPADPPVVVSGVIKKGNLFSDPIAHGLKRDTTYDVLVLVAGFAPFLQLGLKTPS